MDALFDYEDIAARFEEDALFGDDAVAPAEGPRSPPPGAALASPSQAAALDTDKGPRTAETISVSPDDDGLASAVEGEQDRLPSVTPVTEDDR